MSIKKAKAPFHVLTKPIGPICNLACVYCFYLEKEATLFSDEKNFRMSDEVLEQFIKNYIAASPIPQIDFGWQGGEPSLMGIDFFKRVVELQKKYADGKEILNGFQTNGTLIDDAWCEFFAEENFLVGLSVDGPPDLTDPFRVTKKGEPISAKLLETSKLLRKHGVEFNTLSCINRLTGDHPKRVYEYLKNVIGSNFMQFIPLVERKPTEAAAAQGYDLCQAPILGRWEEDVDSPVTSWSVQPEQFGDFLIGIYDEWVRHDVGRVFVNHFDTALAKWVGVPGGTCVSHPTCGRSVALEHNGDVYSCDHYVYPQNKLGNIMTDEFADMLDSDLQCQFGDAKRDELPDLCRDCAYLFACNGECPKHRIIKTPDGEFGLSYLCAGLKKFFNHIDDDMTEMAGLLQQQRSPAEIMMKYGTNKPLAPEPALHMPLPGTVGRNDACPCGSGKKFKKCCGRNA
ncbi:anaerobic sulfatase maturase [Verrucomicrobiota bacterium]